MPKKSRSPITDPLRDAIVRSGLTPLQLERETCVKRQSIMWFLRRERSLRLDKADKLAEFYGLTLSVSQPEQKLRG